MYVYLLAIHTQQTACRRLLATSFGSRIKPTTDHERRTEKTGTPYLLERVSPSVLGKIHYEGSMKPNIRLTLQTVRVCIYIQNVSFHVKKQTSMPTIHSVCIFPVFVQ